MEQLRAYKGKLSKSAEKLTAEQHKQLFTEHLPYEIGMLRYTYGRISRGKSDDGENNALIESFCIHARNIVELIRLQDPCDYDARYFTPDGSFDKDGTFLDKRLLDGINEQISHMSEYRTVDMKQKLGPDDWKCVIDQAEDKILKFERALPSESREIWDAAIKKWTFPLPPTIPSSPPSACTHPMVASSATTHSPEISIVDYSGKKI